MKYYPINIVINSSELTKLVYSVKYEFLFKVGNNLKCFGWWGLVLPILLLKLATFLLIGLIGPTNFRNSALTNCVPEVHGMCYPKTTCLQGTT